MKTLFRRTRNIALLLLVVLVIALRYLHQHALAPAHRSPASAPISLPASADALHFGALQLQRCEIGRRGIGGVGTARAYCTRFDVPENWDEPAGRHIALRVAIVRSSAVRSEPDPVVFLDGGPGGAASEDYPAIAPALAPLRQRRDILLIDQRGTGGSNALSCSTDGGVDQPPAPMAQPPDPSARVRLLQRCLAAVRAHAAPEHYTTSDAIRDLEAFRLALGAPRLNLVGVSYGTRVAQQYAARYPGAVRSVVLDSVVPNTLALGNDHARNLERVLRSLFARCSAEQQCKRAFGDPYATLYRLRDRLRAQPQSLTLRDPSDYQPLQLQLSAADLSAIVRINAYNPITAALLPLTLDQADHGNYAPLVSQKKWISDDLGSELTGGMELSVVCSEDADLLRARPEDASTLLGNDQITNILSACSVWPRGSRPPDFHQPLVAATPVLILAGQYDPVTPPSYATELLRTLTDARVLLAPGQGHAVIGSGCMPRLVREFVDNPDPAALDDRCLQQLGDIPAFIDFNGAAP
jgi:pimeloyl-ACP methyl ester carboxylesterase